MSVVAGLGCAAVVVALVVRAYPNYDTYYALVWGRELLDGHVPSYTAFAAPTPHPLLTIVGAVAGVFAGGHGDRVIIALCALAFAGLAHGVYRLGAAMANHVIGVVAALLVLSSPTFLEYVSRGYVDVPFLALVVWAAVMVAERPASAGPAMSLLGVAGLLRPEGWTLAGLLWLWHARRSKALRPRLLAGALVAPALWGLSDLVVTGDPLYSLHATDTIAETFEFSRGIGEVPGSFVAFVGEMVRAPVLLAAIAGGALAWRWRRQLRALHVAGALFGSGAATFAITGVAGLPVLQRFVTVPAVVVCLLAALLLAGWTLVLSASDRRATPMSVAFVALVIGGVTYATARSEEASRLARDVRYFVAVHDDLHAILDIPAVTAARACGPVSLPTHRQLPDVRWALDTDRNAVVSRADASRAALARRGGVALVALGRSVRTIGRVEGLPRGTNIAPAGFAEVARNATFAAYVRCP